MLILASSAISLVKLEDVEGVFLYFVEGEGLKILKHISGGSAPLPLVSIESLIDKLGDQDCILHVNCFM
jgi:hypothetical protein